MSLTADQLDVMRTGTLELDEATHTYNIGPIILPSLGRILTAAGLCDDFSAVPPFILERKRQIGTAVHLACKYYLLGTLDEDTVAPECIGYFTGFKRYYDSLGNPEPAAVETPLWTDDPWMYACTPDLVLVDGTVIEIKTSAKLSPYVGIQLAGQSACISPNLEVPRHVVQLCKDGTFVPKQCDDPGDFEALVHALGIYYWKATRLLKGAL